MFSVAFLHLPQKPKFSPESGSLPHFSVWLRKNLFPLTLLVVTVLALALRLSLFPYESGDYQIYLQQWYTQIEQGGGLPALRQPLQDCNYTIAYLTLLTPFAALHIHALTAVKAVSTAVLLFPETYFNSALWAQCDAIYTAFCVLCVYFLMRHSYLLACAMFGLAFAFKMQAVFLLPLLVICVVCEKRFRLRFLSAAPAALLLTCIPAIAVGIPLWMTYWPYLVQLGCCDSLSVNCPGAGMLLGNLPYPLLKDAMLAGVLLCLFLVLALVLLCGGGLSPARVLLLGAWCTLCCVVLLPCMHERYAFPADILLLLFAVSSRRKGDILCLLTESAVSLFSWMQYLSPNALTLSAAVLSLLRLGCLLWLTARLWLEFAPHKNVL